MLCQCTTIVKHCPTACALHVPPLLRILGADVSVCTHQSSAPCLPAFLACVVFGLRAAFIRAFPVAGAGAGSNVYFALNGFANGWRSASEWVAVLQLQQPAPPRMLPH